MADIEDLAQLAGQPLGEFWCIEDLETLNP